MERILEGDDMVFRENGGGDQSSPTGYTWEGL